MATVPKRFSFIRTTLALWGADLFGNRAGVVTDAPKGAGTLETWGWYDGSTWRYAARRGGDEEFGNVKVSGLESTGTVAAGQEIIMSHATKSQLIVPTISVGNFGCGIGVTPGQCDIIGHYGAWNTSTLYINAYNNNAVGGAARLENVVIRGRVFLDSQLKQFDTESVSSGTASTTAAVTVGNSTTETSLWGGAKTIAANRITAAGQNIHIKAQGYFSGLNAAALTIRLKIGATVFTLAESLPSAITNSQFRIEGDLTFSAVGASGAVWGYVILHYAATTGRIQPYVIPVMLSNASTAWDTTAAKTLDITWQWTAASASNTVTSQPAPIIQTT